VRPDGYVAWAGTGELCDALERWLGAADRLARPAAAAHSAGDDRFLVIPVS
jgi:hypothetical protein